MTDAEFYEHFRGASPTANHNRSAADGFLDDNGWAGSAVGWIRSMGEGDMYDSSGAVSPEIGMGVSIGAILTGAGGLIWDFVITVGPILAWAVD